MNIETLIEEVQKREYLWKKTSKKYKVKQAIIQGWDEIGKICLISSHDAKKKWRNLRDVFTKERKKQKPNGTYDGRWQYYESLTFLEDCIKPYLEENIDVKTEFAEVMLQNPWETTEDTMNSMEIKNPVSSEASFCSSYTHNSTRKRPSETLKEQSLPMEAKQVHLQNTEEDENLLFFKSLLPYMKRLSPLQQLKIRNNLSNNIMVELEKTHL